VIYLEGTEKYPKEQILRLKFPDQSCYDYKIEPLNLLTCSVADLEKKGLAILLPFYVLKLREQVKNAKDSAELKILSKPVKELLADLLKTIDRFKEKGKIGDTDAQDLLQGLERLYRELFDQYEELVEGDIMLRDKLDLYGDDREKIGEKKGEEKALMKVAKNMLAEGIIPTKVAKCTGLPLKTVKALQDNKGM
jgi:hypothetical protein